MKRESPRLPVAPEQSAPRTRRRWLVVALVVALLGVGGYALGRELWALRHWREGRQALDVGDPERARPALQKCLDYWPDDPQVHLLMAGAERMAGRAAEAAKHVKLARAAGGDPDEVTLQSQLLDAATGKLELVEAALRRHVEAGHPQRRQVMDVLIRAYIARGRAEEAERYATRWIDEAPGDWRPWFLRGFARGELSRDLLSTAFDLAKKDYERALELRPDYAPARLLLGNAYLMTGHFADALPHLEEYRRARPDDPAGAAEHARCLRGLARPEEARRALDDFLAGHAGSADVCLVRGEVAMDEGKPQEALDWLRRAEKLAPTSEKVQFQMAQALRAAGHAEEAQTYEEKWRTRQELTARLAELEKAAARDPKDVAVRHEAGVVALKLGRDAAGLRWLAEALKLDPDRRETHTALADHFQQLGNAAAAAHHRRLAEKRP